MFKTAAGLRDLYPRLLSHSTLCFGAKEVMNFLGRKIRDEVKAMSGRIQHLASHAVQTQRTQWPLEDMLGAGLVSAVPRRIETLHGCAVAGHAVDAALWLRVDSYSLPLLADMGIHTLGEARAAAQKTHLARVKY